MSYMTLTLVGILMLLATLVTIGIMGMNTRESTPREQEDDIKEFDQINRSK